MFSRLNWKLTFSYTLVTVGTLVVLELCALLGFQLAASTAALGWVMGRILQTEAVPKIRAVLTAPEHAPDTLNASLRTWFPQPSEVVNNPSADEILPISGSDQVVLLDPQGRLLARQPADPTEHQGAVFDAQRIPGLGQGLPAALKGETDLTRLSLRDGALITIALPVQAETGELLGVLVVHIHQTRSLGGENLPGILKLLGLSFAVITCLAGVIGTLFGFFTAHSLTHRLRHAAETSAAWGRGDFSQVIRDSSKDELGQLAGQLNAMSQQLQGLMETRQELAALDERNRLARDLHDSVKQQVFAIRMNLGALQSLWGRDPEKARTRLGAALQLTEQAQRELGELIQALRPGALENKDLAAALPELLQEWGKAQGICAVYRVECPVAIPAQVELALFRLTQEALANIAKHSGAKNMILELHGDSTGLTLRITDDGHGFNVGQPTFGFGLRSMRERVETLGGRLEISSSANGTQLVICVP